MTQNLAWDVHFSQGFTDAFSNIIKFVPQFIGFLAILVIGWIICRVIAAVADRVLRRLGSERIAERSGLTAMMHESGYDVTKIIVKLIYYALMLIVLQLAFGLWGNNPVSNLIHGIVAWLPRGIVAVVIFVVAMAIANGVREIVGRVLSGASYGRTVARLAWAFIGVIGVIAALGQAGIAPTVTGPVLWTLLLTIAGVAIVGMGGGLIGPMRQRWERWLSNAERETPNVRSAISDYQAERAARGDQPQWYGGSTARPETRYQR